MMRTQCRPVGGPVVRSARRLRRTAVLLAAAAAALPQVVRADLTWDPGATDATVVGGTGVWNNATPNWTSDAGATNVPWDNSVAIFGGTGGVVTIDQPGGVSATGLTFNVAGYEVAGAQPLTLTGGGTVNAAAAATISAVVGGSVGLTKTGAGTLTLSAAAGNTFTGTVAVQLGTLGFSADNQLGAAANAVNLGTAASVGGLSYTGSSATIARNLVLGTQAGTAAGNVINVATAGQTLTLTGNITGGPAAGAGNTALTVTGAGTLFLNPGTATNNTFTGNIVVDGGRLQTVGENGTPAGDPNRLGAGTKSITLMNGGRFISLTTTINPTSTNTKSFVTGAGGGVIETGSTLQLDDANQFAGTGNLTKEGAGNLSLGTATIGYATFDGPNVFLNAGSIELRNVNALGDALPAPATAKTLITISNGATLRLRQNAALAFNYPVALGTGNGIISVDRIDAGSGLTHTLTTLSIGTQTLEAQGGNGYNLAFSGPATLTGNPTFNANSANLTLASLDGGGAARTITKTGNAVLFVTAAGTGFTGTTTVTQTGGEIFLSNPQAFGPAATVTATGANVGVVQVGAAAAGYTYSVAADGLIGGDNAFLGSLNTGAGGNLNQFPATIAQTEANANENLAARVGGFTNKFFGIAGTIAGEDVAVGTGTPWAGISNDRTSRVYRSGTVTLNGPITVRALGGTFDLGDATGTTGAAALNFVAGAGGAQVVTVASGNTVRLLGGTTTASGGVGSADFSGVTRFVIASGANLQAGSGSSFNVLGGFNGTARAGIEIQSGGTLNLNGGATGTTPAGAINGPVTVLPGGILLADDNNNLNGTGTITMSPGSILQVSNSPFGVQSPNTVPGVIVRLAGDSPAALDENVSDGAIFVAFHNNSTSAQTRTVNGPITLNGGTLTMDAGAARTFAGTSPVTITGAGGTLAATTSQTFTISKPITAAGAPITIGAFGNIDGQTKIGSVNLTNAANSFTGGTAITVTAGAVARAPGTATGATGFGAGAPFVLPNGTIAIDGPAGAASSGNVGAVTLAGVGTLAPRRNATTPATTVLNLTAPLVRNAAVGSGNRGALLLTTSAANVLATNEQVRFGSAADAPARLTADAGAGPVTLNMVAPYIVNGTDNTYVDYNPAGSTGFTNVTYDVNGSSFAGSDATKLVNITGNATVTGTVSAAVVRTNSNITGGSINVSTGGIMFTPLTNNPGATISSAVNFGAAEAVIYNNSAQLGTLSGVVAGTGGLTKFGTNSVTLSNAANTFTGGITIDQGNLRPGANNAFPVGNVVVVNQAGTLDLNNFNQAVAGLAGTGTVNNQLAGTRTLTINNADPYTFAGTILSGTGVVALTKTGSGTQTLTGANTYTGATAVTGGTLLVNNAAGSGTGTGAVTVSNAGSTIGGTGSIAGNLTLNAGAVLSPGASPGTLAVGGALALNDAATTLIELAGTTPGDAAGNYDQVNVAGAAPLAGTLAVNLLDGFTPSAADVFYVLSRGSGAGAFNGVGEGGTVGLPDGSTFNLTYLANWTGSQATSTPGGGNDVALYNFQPVPEPGTVGLLGAAAAGLLARRRRRQ